MASNKKIKHYNQRKLQLVIQQKRYGGFVRADMSIKRQYIIGIMEQAAQRAKEN